VSAHQGMGPFWWTLVTPMIHVPNTNIFFQTAKETWTVGMAWCAGGFRFARGDEMTRWTE
jgi:hypothetical protein